MYTGFVHLHSSLPYLILLGLALSTLTFLVKRSGGKGFAKGDKRLAMFTLILVHIQLVVGLVLYVISPIREQAFASGELMSNSTYRFTAIEHPLIMIIAIVLITIGYSKAKRKTEDKAKFGTLGLFYGLGLILVLSRMPWDIWPGW
jgi:NADH:ubiquinone oxidoreductase subunit 2 (subunit N)